MIDKELISEDVATVTCLDKKVEFDMSVKIYKLHFKYIFFSNGGSSIFLFS